MTVSVENSYHSINQSAIEAGENYRVPPLQRMRPDRSEIMNPVESGLHQTPGDGQAPRAAGATDSSSLGGTPSSLTQRDIHVFFQLAALALKYFTQGES